MYSNPLIPACLREDLETALAAMRISSSAADQAAINQALELVKG